MLQENRIKVGKYNINYLKVGHGTYYVLCMPGSVGTIWTDFKPQIEGFDREKFSLIIWDPPGYGRSRPPEREFHADHYGQDVDTAVEFMKALNIPKYSIMGWCYGGVTSVNIAVKHPEVMHKLVVWGVRAFIQKHELEFLKQVKDINIWSEQMLQPKLEFYGKEKLSELVAKNVDKVEAVYHNKRGVVLAPEFTRNVNCPTFILHGEKDPLTDKSNATFLHKYIQGSRVYFYPEGKHNIHLRYAEDFNKRVQEFLLQG